MPSRMLSKRRGGRFAGMWLAGLGAYVGLFGLSAGCSQGEEDGRPSASKSGATSTTTPSATPVRGDSAKSEPKSDAKSDVKNADKGPAPKGGAAMPTVRVTAEGETASGSPPEKELVFADTRIKLRLVEGNHTKNKREVIAPYYISVEPLPNEILRRCTDLAGCKTPPPAEDQDSKPVNRLSVDDAKLILKMLKTRLPTHAEWVNAHHAGVIKRMDCELTQFNSISIVQERGADGVFETPLSDEIRFTYSPEVDTAHMCGMRIAMDAETMSKSDSP